MPKWIAFMKKGTFKDSSGVEHTFSDEKLDAIVAKYNPSQHEAPEVIGHPKTDAPAWGWVKGVKREGDVLFYEPGKRVSEFQEMINKGMFKKRSAAFYPDLTLKHIGWLGAQPPAVKGLPDPATFAEGESIVIEFSEWKNSAIGRTFQRIREFLIEKFDMETADRVISSYDCEEIMRPETEPVSAYSESNKEEEDMGKIEELEKELADERAKTAAFSESEKKKDADLAAEKEKNRLLVVETRRKDFAAFCEGLTKEGKLPPAIVPGIMDFMEILSGVETFEFAEGDGKKVAAAPLERFKTMLGGLGKVISFSEHATKGKMKDDGGAQGEAGEKLHAFAEEKMKANKDLTYKMAFSEAQKEHAELAAEYAEEIRG